MNVPGVYKVMKKVCHITIIVLFFALNAAAQNNKHGDVVIHSDPRLSVLLNKKRMVMQASAAKPVTHKSEDIRMSAGAPHSVAEAAPIAGAVTRPNAAIHSTGETARPAARAPVYIRDKEGRVIYSGKGFRVQIYSGNDREKAIMVKTEFMRHFPGVRTYLTYVSPRFRVKVGNYRNRSEAAGMLKEVNSMYNPSVIVPDMITINTF
ncbi:MAG: SPOR domain-containing protein [Chitinophagales bacterium]